MHATHTTQGMTLRIERMSYGTDAIAHTDEGKTVFVRGAMPGDTVVAHVVEEGKSFSRAVTDEVPVPSADRVQPACPYTGICGGCPWAHLSHEAQLLAKRTGVVDALTRIGHVDLDVAQGLVRPCAAPSKPWGYRNKVELGFAHDARRPFLGMHAIEGTAAPGLVKVDACPLLDRRHQRLVKGVSGALGYLSGHYDLELERVGIRASERTGDVEVALWTKPGPFPRKEVAKVLGDATKATSIVRVMTKGAKGARKVAGVEALEGRGHWRERLGDNTMLLSAPSFFQVNTAGAEKLLELVLDGLALQQTDEAMDLYCGAGTFTLPLAQHADWVSAVESYGPAIRDLRRNLDKAWLDNVDAVGGDANREFPDTQADVIVVDPPRAGLAPDVIRKLSRQPARAIAYVSCDPATLARDLGRFDKAGTFRPASITPVDLFPQTFHVETVTLLVRRA